MIKTLDPKRVKVAFLGRPIEFGLADGVFVNISRLSDGFESVAGADGSVCRIALNDSRAEVTMTYKQTSPVLSFLSGIYEADRAAPNGAGVGPLRISETISGDVWLGADSYIQSISDRAFSKSIEEVEVVFLMAKLQEFLVSQSF